METIIRAMVSGALDYFQWPVEEADLRRLILDAKKRELIWRKEASFREEALESVKALTSREKQVLARIGRGLSNKDIARGMEISPRTVEVHRANLYKKINAVSTADAVRIAIHAGLDWDG